jgi:hypothetical protein
MASAAAAQICFAIPASSPPPQSPRPRSRSRKQDFPAELVDAGGDVGRCGLRAEETVLCPLGVGALGLLRGLETLSVTADFDRGSGLGLFGLSSLELLTCLELLQARNRKGADMVRWLKGPNRDREPSRAERTR